MRSGYGQHEGLTRRRPRPTDDRPLSETGHGDFLGALPAALRPHLEAHLRCSRLPAFAWRRLIRSAGPRGCSRSFPEKRDIAVFAGFTTGVAAVQPHHLDDLFLRLRERDAFGESPKSIFASLPSCTLQTVRSRPRCVRKGMAAETRPGLGV